MKKAEEYFEKIPYSFDIPNIKEWVCDQIRCAQKDAIKGTVQACADNAELNSYEVVEDWMIEPFNMTQDDYGNIRAINKSSILEVADKLIKELE